MMLRRAARFIAFIFALVAVIAAVLDITRSIADSSIVMTSLGQDWFNWSVDTLNFSQAIIQRYVHPYLWDPIIQTVLQWPSWLVFFGLALIFALLGRQKKHRWQDRYRA